MEIFPKCGVRCGGVTIHGLQNETIDFSEGTHEWRPLFMYALALVRDLHLKSPIEPKQTPPSLRQAGSGSLWKVKR